MNIQAFSQDQLPELVKLQNGLAPARRHMSAAILRDALMDSARNGGKNVCLAYAHGELSGFFAWVEGEKAAKKGKIGRKRQNRVTWGDLALNALAINNDIK
jgi:hypothetical protein